MSAFKRAGSRASGAAQSAASSVSSLGGETASQQFETFQKAWGIVAPTVMLIWIIPVFLINFVIWTLLFLYALPRAMLNVYFIPVFLLAAATGLLLLQANQDAIVELSNTSTACLDQIYQYFAKNIWDDLVRCMFPVCTLINYYVQVLKYLIRLVVDEYRCYWTCDPDVCPCDTCDGGNQCECPLCEASPAACVCDNDLEGCPSAGGFAIFTDCCGCFITALEEGFVLAGFTVPEAITLVADLIDFFDIVPADPVLVTNFVDNFPQPGSVDWFWPGSRNIRPAGSSVVTSTFHPGRHIRQLLRSTKPLLLERYANLTANGADDPGTMSPRCLPQNIIDIMTPGNDGYSTLIFEIICQDFFGPFIELFMEVVLWLFNFLAVFFDLGWDQILSYLDDLPSTFQDMVQDLFRLFTHEFLCTLLNWDETLELCCLAIDLSNPVDFILSLLKNPCLGIPQSIINCLSSNSAFVNCVLDVINGANSITHAASTTVTDTLTTLADTISSAHEDIKEYNRRIDVVRNGGFGPPVDVSRDDVDKMINQISTAVGAMSRPQLAYIMEGLKNEAPHGDDVMKKYSDKTWLESVLGVESPAPADEGGGGYAPHETFLKTRVEGSIMGDAQKRKLEAEERRRRVGVSAPMKETQGTYMERKDRLIEIHKNSALRAFHERMLGMTMDVAYPELRAEFQRSERKRKDSMWKERMRGLVSGKSGGFSMYAGLGAVAERSVRAVMDAVGARAYDNIESYVSRIGVGEPSYFTSPTYSNRTLQLLRAHATRMHKKHPTTAFDRDLHERKLRAEEMRFEREHANAKKRFAQLDPWMQLTHGQKALRYTSMWTSAIKEMILFPKWNDELYDFEVPSINDLTTEFNGREIGTAIIRSLTHWGAFLKQDNAQRDMEMNRTIDDRPAVLIRLEVTLKMMAWRFAAPWALENLRETLSQRGPRWNSAARFVINPAIEARDRDIAERQRRKEAFERGDKGATIQLPELDLSLVIRWFLEKASFRTAQLFHRTQVDDAIRSGNRTRYILLKMYEEENRNPITLRVEHEHRQVLTGNNTHLKKSRVHRDTHYACHHRDRTADPDLSEQVWQRYYGAQFDRIVKERGHDIDTWTYWMFGHDSSPRGRGAFDERAIDPEALALFRDHRERMSRATSANQMIDVTVDTAHRIPQLAAVAAVVLPFIKNIRFIIGAAAPVLSSPYAQNIYKMYFDFFNSQIGSIVREPIADLVNSPGFLIQFGEDFSVTTLETIDYVVAEIERTLLCLAPQIVIQTLLAYASLFAMLIPYIGQVMSTVIAYFNTIGTFFMPLVAVCPPDVQIGQQNFLTFLFDTLDCSNTISCTTEDQCPGGAPCRCPPATTQWQSLFWAFNGDFQQTCPGDSGYCLCFWEFPCDLVFPDLEINTLFDDQCSKFGYATGASIVPWYPGNRNMFSSLGNFLYYIKKWINSAIIWFRFITRSVVRGYEPFFPMSTFIAITGLAVGLTITFGRVFWIFAVLILMIGIAFGSPLLTQFVSDAVIPAIERVGNTFGFLKSITNWLLEFLRWPNYTDMDPIGSPEASEITCFFFNSGTGMMAIGIFAISAVALQIMFQIGMLTGILLFLVYIIMIVPRTVYRTYEFFIFISQSEEQDQEGGYAAGGYGEGGYGEGGGYAASTYSPGGVEYGGPLDTESSFYDRYMVYGDNQDDVRNVPVTRLIRDIPDHVRALESHLQQHYPRAVDWKAWKIDVPEFSESVSRLLPASVVQWSGAVFRQPLHRSPNRKKSKSRRFKRKYG